MDGITITGAGAEFFFPEWDGAEWRLKLIKRPPASLRTISYSLVEELDGVTRTSAQTSSTSDPETPAPTPAPTVTTAPSITATATDGAIRVGATIQGTPGSYTGSPAIQRSWSRDGQLISGATGLTITASQPGAYLMRETATNAGGSVTATSNTLTVQAAVTPPPTGSALIEGAIEAPLVNRITFPAVPGLSAVPGAPLGAMRFAGDLDPQERQLFAVSFSLRLAPGDKIADYELLQVGAAGALMGLTIDDAVPLIVNSARDTIQFALKINPANHNDSRYEGQGLPLAVTVRVKGNLGIGQTYENTALGHRLINRIQICVAASWTRAR